MARHRLFVAAFLCLAALTLPTSGFQNDASPDDAGANDAGANHAGANHAGGNDAGPVEAPRETAAQDASTPTYADLVTQDRPVAYWRFSGDGASATGPAFAAEAVGGVRLNGEGPRGERYPAFEADNTACWFKGDGGRLRVADVPLGDSRPLQFRQGDAITLDAWVNVAAISNGQQMYVVGKGRTKNAGFAAENQNYALRLSGENGQAVLSFLFRDADNRDGERDDYHRWNSKEGFGVDSGWHHVAVTYEFGKPGSIRGYIDGKVVAGTWDYGGATAEPPVVDEDEVWIGSSMGGSPGSTFMGGIDEVAIYRTALAPERIAARYHVVEEPPYETPPELVPSGAVLVEVIHGIPGTYSWSFRMPEPFERFTQPEWALVELPQLYTRHGVRADRTNPLVVRLTGRVTLPPGEHRMLLRSRSAARLYVDGKLVAENMHPTRGGDGHGPLYEVVSHVSPHIRPLQPGDSEADAKVVGTGEPLTISVDVFVGGKKRRLELGEMCVALGDAEGRFRVLGFGSEIPLTDDGWETWADARRARLAEINRDRRAAASADYAAYWARRHEAARRRLAERPALGVPPLPAGMPALNAIDHFVGAKLAAAGVEPLPLADDFAFLRRVCLDLVGTAPTPEILGRFLADPPAERRARVIDRLLEQPGWADHWVPYWQDALAENPNVINPTLNNTGPFRFWIHESFNDNKPLDRFATELILMEGSTRGGGTAGFGVASQNDAPMAAKAHVIAQAFLGMEMKCARCHDAPHHDFTQRDLFSLAAMLKRGPDSVPKTSTVPGAADPSRPLLIRVTLKPGEPVPPEWPFADQRPVGVTPDLLEDPNDSRERLAAIVTSPDNPRFGRVAANRLWKRYLGRGLVEPASDWEAAEPSHPELLEYLERELIGSGYDLKHVARLILNSHAYQRQTDLAAATDSRRAALFAGPTPRRLAAEQVLDSLFAVSGKSFRTEELNIDVDGLREGENSLGFGFPSRAWEFTSLSNERDRPSLSLPATQTMLDVLEPFGWRTTRPDPVQDRPQEFSALQPAVLANGVVAKRTAQFSDDSRFTELALRDTTVEEFVDSVYRAVLSRPPAEEERTLMTSLLRDGFESRRRLDRPSNPPRRPRATGVSWTNHLQPKANEIKIAQAAELEKGDPPTERLDPAWRERAEDVVWALINSPEFVLVP